MKSKIPVYSIRRKDGFSLIEILLVLGLIGLLTGAVVVNFDKIFGGGEEQIAKIFVNSSLDAALLKYRIDTGGYPSTAEGLKALITAPGNKAAKWKGPYIKELSNDPWGNPYRYRYPGTKNTNEFDLYSLGADGTESADDIGNWEK